VSRFNTEAEYKTMTDTIAELMWIQYVLKELRILCPPSARLWYDNIENQVLNIQSSAPWQNESC
jgi:hypothetical protein